MGSTAQLEMMFLQRTQYTDRGAAMLGRMPTGKLFPTIVYEVFIMFKVINKGFKGFVARVGRERVRREFLSRNDRYLDDIGVSRDLLEEGVDAWPWKPAAEFAQIVKPVTNRGVAASEGFRKLASFAGLDSLSSAPNGFSR